jgi:hypothetical protein
VKFVVTFLIVLEYPYFKKKMGIPDIERNDYVTKTTAQKWR